MCLEANESISSKSVWRLFQVRPKIIGKEQSTIGETKMVWLRPVTVGIPKEAIEAQIKAKGK